MEEDLHIIELESEVREWLTLLPDKHYRKVEEYAELLAALGTRTPMPFARPLRDGVYELRPTLNGEATRVTYWFAPEHRVVLLTVFHKTRAHEAAQVERAVRARLLCAERHGRAHITYSRDEKGEPS
ncbi:type II toxin-antitoxin system RelE/ParE family toxin [Streptomyces roseicoloratus]|uniref:Type II toxin-antitoxin system RelE/ParE family toxin n=1 Tax=Streptomyces roseicoloratus TaxID=2508722 RepID=A0ABY9RUF0_9ACTN|nr:type II toxin-antitoxin system RelE/ParE family toxin [Streptomyces roseicoloratus]WMX45807.1 type II toxin-antitoxin system RelE/ParE family toxin [Streptomyces roseicoloratus]